MAETSLIVAVDRPDLKSALLLARQLDPALCRLKVGLELYSAVGPGAVEALMRLGFGVFLDLKFHDIPNTVAGACRAAARLGVWMLNVHGAGGPAMLAAAAQAVAGVRSPPLLVGVTVLTSMDSAQLGATGVQDPPEVQVVRLAELCRQGGLNGVVCSPLEIALLRARMGEGFVLVTPGIRSPRDAADDQRRTLPAAAALAAGASYLVVGRPVTGAKDPGAALAELAASLTAPAA